MISFHQKSQEMNKLKANEKQNQCARYVSNERFHLLSLVRISKCEIRTNISMYFLLLSKANAWKYFEYQMRGTYSFSSLYFGNAL